MASSALKFMNNKRGNGTVQFLIGLTVVMIIAVSFTIPTINQLIDDPNSSLTTSQKALLGTVVTLVIVFVITIITSAM